MKKISLITGGSSGLGLSVAKELVAQGYNVCIIGRNQEKLNNAVETVSKNILSYCGDIADESFIKYVFADLQEKGYYVDYLYNNAGIGYFGEPEKMNMENIQKVINTNVVGLMAMSYECCRNMTEGGTIVNIMSTAALKGNANETLYCASKWAVRGFTEALKAYYKGKKIHVIGVYPGGMKTPFWSPECGMSPNLAFFMEPDEVAKVIVFNVTERKTSYTADITIERI